MTSSFTADVITLLAIPLGMWWARNFVSTYMKEKARNLATKQGIAKITEQIHRVRSTHIAELQKLKSSLEVAAGDRSAFAEGQRDALISFFENSMLLIEMLNRSLGERPIDKVPLWSGTRSL